MKTLDIFLRILMLFTLTLLFSFKGCFTKEKDSEVVDVTAERLKTTLYFEVNNVTEGPGSYLLHQSGQNNSETACRISKDSIAQTQQELLCWFEAEELDLLFYGLNLRATVPAGVCDYFNIKPYWFWNWAPGYTTGTVDVHTIPDECLLACGGVCDCGGTACSSTSLNKNPPTFNFDYSEVDGPNCDEGKITQNSISWSFDSDISTTQCLSTTTVEYVDGGGKYTNCLMGPGKEYLTDSDGWPIAKVLDAAEGVEEDVTVKDPVNVIAGYSIYYADYTKECAIDTYNYSIDSLINYSEGSATTSNNGAGDSRKGITVTTPFGLFTFASPTPAYIFTCFDKAREVLARITVQVRDWDTHFTSADNIDQTAPAKMDVSGNEPGSYGAYDDHLDWDTSSYNAGTVNCLGDANSTGFNFPQFLDR